MQNNGINVLNSIVKVEVNYQKLYQRHPKMEEKSQKMPQKTLKNTKTLLKTLKFFLVKTSELRKKIKKRLENIWWVRESVVILHLEITTTKCERVGEIKKRSLR